MTDRTEAVEEALEEKDMDVGRIEEIILDFIRTSFMDEGDAPLDRDANLFTGGLIDSVGIVRLIAHMQDALGVIVPATDLVPDNFRSVRVMAAYLRTLATA